MVRAIMHGCNGHMGQVITGLIKADEGIELVAGIDKYTGIANDYPVFESLEKCDVEADVIIDFSNAAAADALLTYCEEKKMPVVLCTTGLSEEQLAKIPEAAKKTAVDVYKRQMCYRIVAGWILSDPGNNRTFR